MRTHEMLWSLLERERRIIARSPRWLAVALLACSEPAGAPADGDLFPLLEGAVWTYRVTDTGSETVGQKIQRVVGTVQLPEHDEPVFQLETVKPNGDRTVSHQRVVGADVVRYSEEIYRAGAYAGEETYAPHKLRVPKSLPAEGGTRTETYTERTYNAEGVLVTQIEKTEEWIVEGTETVVVPAGTFEGAVRLRRIGRTTRSEKRFWFVAGVGKVREEGLGQIEELERYERP